MTEERHEQVLSSLLDLQAKLREEAGSAGEPGSRSRVIKLPENARRPASDETVSVTEGDLEVSSRSSDEPALASVTPLPITGSQERVSALSSRLHRLERDLDPVITRIEESDGTERSAAPEPLSSSAMDDQFVQLQKEIARRLDEERDLPS